MPEEGLRIVIEADVSKAQAGLVAVTASAQNTVLSLDKISPAAVSASTGLDKMAQSSIKITPAANSAVVATQKMATQLSKVGPSANAANVALINTGRVLQDLPFGFIGIANNINPLLESFQRLQKETGSVGGALKSLIAGLAGGGGLGLAVSAITSALSFAAIGLQAFSRGMGKTEQQADDTKDSIQNLLDSFKDLPSIANIKIASIAGTDADIAKLHTLADAVRDTNLSYQERQRALKQLQDANQSYFGDLTLETKSLETLRDRLNEYTEALIQAAVTKGFASEIEKLAPNLAKINKAFNDSTDNIDKLKKKLDEVRKLPPVQPQVILPGGTAGSQVQQQVSNITAEELKLTQAIQDEEKGRDKLSKTLQEQRGNMAELQDQYREAILTSLKFKDLDTKKTSDSLTELQRKVIELAKQAEKVFDVPLTLRFDDTNLDIEKLANATRVLEGIRDFTIKAKVDIDLPDIKELPKESVEKFFINVPNALQDAIDKGIIAFRDGIKIPVKTDALDPDNAFSKQIEAAIAKFNNAKVKIPLDIEVDAAEGKLKGAAFLEALLKGFDTEQLKKKLQDGFKVGDFESKLKIGVDLGKLEDSLKKARGSLGGITEEAAFAANAINQILTPAFENMFQAIIEGEPPLKAFFNSIIQSIEQLISKLIAAAIQAAILSAINIGTGGFGSIFSSLLGFAKGGDPPVGKPSLVGEKGPELIVPKSQMHVFSHEQSKSILSSSVREHESIKQYFINEKIASTVKEYLHSYDFSSVINKSIESMRVNMEKVQTSMTQSMAKLSERFSTITTHVQKLSETITNTHISEHIKTFSIEKFATQFNIPKFASGGAVFAPTLALLGEGFGISRSNPEFVGTASQLRNITGGNFNFSHSFDGKFSIDGSDLLLILNRAMRSSQRTSGKNGLGG